MSTFAPIQLLTNRALGLALLLELSSQSLFAQEKRKEEEVKPDRPIVLTNSAGRVSPPKAISTPAPDVSPGDLNKKNEGTVVLAGIVRMDGRVEEVHVTRSLDPKLDKLAIEAVKKWRFQPATKDGKPVSVHAAFEVAFNLAR